MEKKFCWSRRRVVTNGIKILLVAMKHVPLEDTPQGKTLTKIGKRECGFRETSWIGITGITIFVP
jgi:tRNA(Phe) wybutosine-synthesizing methylase Tyw3